MPIIPQVGRKALRYRLLFILMHTVLILGATTMVYPFLLMLGTSLTSSTDTTEFRVVPRYFYRENALFAKYVDDKYAGELPTIDASYHTDFKKLTEIVPPTQAGSADSKRLVAEWREFVKALPLSYLQAGFRGYGTHPSQLNLAYRRTMRVRFHDDIRALNDAYGEQNETFDTVVPPLERSIKRAWIPDATLKMREFLEWKRTLPQDRLLVVGVEPMFAQYLTDDVPAYGGEKRLAAKTWRTMLRYGSPVVSEIAPSDPRQRRDWEDFVRTHLPYRYITVLPEAVGAYRGFLQKKYGRIEKLNALYQARCANFDAFPLPTELPPTGQLLQDWGEFLAGPAPLADLRVDTPENRFRAYVALKSAQAGKPLSAAELEAVSPPYSLADSQFVSENATALRRDYATRNYRMVIDYVLLHGRALWVTAIFCLAMVLTTLTVNPLCAYALSRYHLPYAYNVLLFLLATMAFPAEVAMIPNFLMLKQLGMLNTYFALILPGAASGFSIFLLKGFFDSLPKELYEAGLLDGAGEVRMFFTITLPLSRPIFAVIALEAFTAAYGAFMFALIVCQNPKMWTLMVWLYQLQIGNPQYVTMAALAVAALPTLLVFVFAQNVILRGIILPTEK